MGAQNRTGVVLIGRNEGPRLVRSLESVCDGHRPVVYVDSASTDASCEEAKTRGAYVVELDMTKPFSAARARNAGWRHLLDEHPDLELVQFIDGDCEVVEGWLDAAEEVLLHDPGIVAVCGWRRERHPERSLYNRVCDVEWRHGSVGEIRCFGGDVMIRVSALRQVEGYDAGLIAGEDEEIGIRLRRASGGSIERIDRDSTLHDAAMYRFGQWWQRAKRCGHAYAQVNRMHGAPPERHYEANLRRTILWGLVAPVSAVALTLPTFGLSWLTFARYPLAAVRTAMRTRAKGFPMAHAVAWGVSCAVQPFPEMFGVAKFHADRLRSKTPEIIEYKGAAS